MNQLRDIQLQQQSQKAVIGTEKNTLEEADKVSYESQDHKDFSKRMSSNQAITEVPKEDTEEINREIQELQNNQNPEVQNDED